MHKFHKSIYDAMTSLAAQDTTSARIPSKVIRYLASTRHIKVSDTQEVHITDKGLALLGRLEEFKHNDRNNNFAYSSTWR